jgi:quercetin dioxygenase-like cupin family protein
MNGHQVRVLVTGLEGGRGCVIEDRTLQLEPAEGINVWHTTAFAPASSPLHPNPGHAPYMDIPVPSGSALWMVMDYEAGEHQAMHRTDTVDLDIVLEGSMSLTLDDGVHHLAAGDGVIMNAIDHAWTAGPDGCRMSVTFLGTSPHAYKS